MRNPVRVPGVTCAVCTAPIAPQYTHCFRCLQDTRSRHPLADRVVPLTYAIFGEQSNIDMHRYKAPMPEAQRVRTHSYQRVQLLLLAFARTHAACLMKVATRPPTRLATVPSLSGRSWPHPLAMVAEVLPSAWQRTSLHATPGVHESRHRELNPDHFSVPDPASITGRHVVLLEDTWVQGGHAQSAAAALLSAGAVEVSLLLIARRIRPDALSVPTESLLQQVLHAREYSLETCPLTGGGCP